MSKIARFAIVTTVPLKKDVKTGQYRPSYSLRMMVLHASRLGISTIIAHPDHFHWNAKTVTGWMGTQIGTSQESWQKQTVALPDVVYDNVFVHLVFQGKTSELRRQCKRLGIQVFNPIVPGKYTVNRIMEKVPSMRGYVPETKPIHTPEDVLQLLRKHKVVYVKPSGGYGGQGVTRIDLQPNGLFRIRMDRIGGKRVERNQIVTEAGLRSAIKKRIKINHIVQQGIQLLEKDGGKVDFRVVVQRVRSGKWECIGIIPKVARPGGVVTNLVAGGHTTSVSDLRQWASRNGKPLPIEQLEAAAKDIAAVWSKRLPNLGIIGFDMGIDRNGKVWMIELNPKPARSLLTAEMRMKSYQAVAEHTLFLLQRSTNKPVD